MSGGSNRTLTGLDTAQSQAKNAINPSQKTSVSEDRFLFMICTPYLKRKMATHPHANQ